MATMKVEGLKDADSAKALKEKLEKIKDVSSVSVDQEGGTVTITMKLRKKLSEEDVKEALKDSGFTIKDFELMQ